MRNKLIELIDKVKNECRNIDCDKCTYIKEYGDCCSVWIADHLLANGATLQKWIPVKEPPKEEGTYFVVDEYGYVFTAFYWKEKRWWLRDGRRAHPTHWNTIQLSAPPQENE